MEESNFIVFSDAEVFLSELRTKSEEFWIAQGEALALATFHQAAQRVPAYKDFLYKAGINAAQIRTIEDFEDLPLMDKENYISRYSLEQRCLDGVLAQGSIVSYSSGSSGSPTLWPRFWTQEQESALLHDVLLCENFEIDKKKTLIVVCFALGIHIAGVITVNALERMLQKKYPITLVTPGKNKGDVLSAVIGLGHSYEQIIFFGHPGFIKEIVDNLNRHGFDWSKSRFGCVVSGGGFFESWREYLLNQTKQADKWGRVIGLYGCTDAGALAYETMLSISARRYLPDKQEPNLFQYFPSSRYMESINEELVVTAPTGAPLIRYNIHDRGQIFSYKAITEKMDSSLLKNSWQLPFVSLYGRPNMVVVNGANIYNEHIQRALEHKQCLPHITGRFTASVEYDESHDERFVINVESKDNNNTSPDFESWLKEHVVSSLMEYNKEYADCARAMGEKVHPHIKLYMRGDVAFEISQEGKKRL